MKMNAHLGILGTCIIIETALMSKFPPAFPEFLDIVEGRPTRINDRMSHILGWYLPGIISDEFQVAGMFFLTVIN